MVVPSVTQRLISAFLALAMAVLPFRHVYSGDILRGGGVASPSRQPGASLPGSDVQPEVGAAGRDSLARTTQALQAVRAMQEAARNAAVSGPNNLGLHPAQPTVQLPNVPNGLTSGGLQVAPNVSWQGANQPTQSATANGGAAVNIQQTAQQALLNWQTFNVGKQTKVTFDQTAGGENARQWIAFNKINDPSGNPSQILGSIDALGQVFLMNQNGIIFGGSSQVNVHTLVASSLPINDNLISRGLLNNPDQQFLFSSLTIPALGSGSTMPAFVPPPAPNTPDGKSGAVIVQAGAQLNSSTNADHVGGRIALVGPDVRNSGAIATPDGQTILAAGEQVAFAAHSTADPTLRGVDVFIGAVDPARGNANNFGLIDAPRANVTLAGRSVNQSGFIDSSTSVSLNGRIDLLANFNSVQVKQAGGEITLNPTASGLVTLASDSVTRILPELESNERVVGTQLALPSLVAAQGQVIHLAESAILFAPGATTPADRNQPALSMGGGTLSAGVTLSAGRWLAATTGYNFVFNGGQVYLENGALIDVAGSMGVQASVAENFIEAQLRGSELANFPLQRDGALRGQTVTIDIRDGGTYNGQNWVGTPLADLRGYVNLVQRTVGELTTNGGTIDIRAGDSFVMQPGAGIDVSGGWIDYQGAFVQTTKVISGGNIFEISQATPDRIYDGIYNGSTTVHPKWGIVETNSSGIINGAQFEAGYRQGANGGALSIAAPGMALDGVLSGQTVAGPRQRVTPPTGSTLSLAFRAQEATTSFLVSYPTPPDIVFQSGSTVAAAEAFGLNASGNPLPLRADRIANAVLTPELLTAGGFANLNVDNSDGDIFVPAEVSLTSAPGGSVSLTGANIRIAGQISAPGGALSFNSLDVSPSELFEINQTPRTPPVDPTRGNFTLQPGALLTTAGLITDQRLPSDALETRALAQNGGSIRIAGLSVYLAPETTLDVSGGAVVDSLARTTYGSGGTITVNGGQDPSVPSLVGGAVGIAGTLRGYSGTRGGTLNLQAPLVRIGTPFTAGALNLPPEFFSAGGFNSFIISGIGVATSIDYLPAVVIGPDTTIAPSVENLLVNLERPNEVSLDRTTLPLGVRAPVNLSFIARGATAPTTPLGRPLVRGDFIMGNGASIVTEPGGSVSIRGDTAAVLGNITAHGGNISISGGNNSATLFPDGTHPLPTVDLGPRSSFDVSGATVLTPNSLGFRTGSVLAGGNITVSGNIVAELGSLLNVSGASDVLDLAPGYSNSAINENPGFLPLVPTRVESNAGRIAFTGAQELFLDSTLIGLPGGASANGGSVTVTSDSFVPPGPTTPRAPLDKSLFITQSGPTIPEPFYAAGENAIGRFVTGTNERGGGHLAADILMGAGIESLSLQPAASAAVEFTGPVTLTMGRQITLTSGVIFADAQVNLNAPYLRVGTAFAPPVPFERLANAFTVNEQPFYFPPQFGSGTFTASGRLIDIGNLSMQGIGSTNFIAANGDIRGDGTLNAAGGISLTAAQIYPVTGVRFTIAADDYEASGFNLFGIVTINQSGAAQTPLSAGGELNVYGSIIRQGGTLRAPIGTINLGTIGSTARNAISNLPFATARQLTIDSGSVTSVSADGLTIPYGTNQNGTAWIDPAGVDITVGGVPGKTINLAGANLADVSGSTIDIRGGGDLLAYRFVSGIGGTNDILASNGSFAIVPGYAADFSPIDPGYANSTLAVGDRIFLSASDVLAEGSYTLLPARYALLPGGVLVTPQSGAPNAAASELANGTSVVSGYRFNALNPARTGAPLPALFELAPPEVIKARAQYDLFSANTFLRDAAIANGADSPRLPIDSGRLVLTASQTMAINGAVRSQAPMNGRGGLVDINSPADIFIGGAGALAPEGALFLDAAQLSGFAAQSLLIGGVRGENVDVSTRNLTLDNAGAPLTGSDIILVATDNLTLAPGAQITASGTNPGLAEELMLEGDGALVRVNNGVATSTRTEVGTTNEARLTIGAGARLSGNSVTLDSTFATAFAPTTILDANAVFLNSGQVSLQLDNAGALLPTDGLVLTAGALAGLQNTARNLSFLSYSSIDIYGTGQVGSSAVETLALHAGEIRGFNNAGGGVRIAAKNILLDNSPNRTAAAAFGGGIGALEFDAETIQLGANRTNIDQFSSVVLNASGAVIAQSEMPGALSVSGNLRLRTPLITGAAGAEETLTAVGTLTLDASSAGTASNVTGGLGAQLTLEGARIAANTNIVLPSGAVTMRARLGDVSLGGSINVAGTAQSFFDLVRYTSGGSVNLISDLGNVSLLGGSKIDVGAVAGGGDAGNLSIRTLAGTFIANGTLRGVGGAGGGNGSFNLEVGELAELGSVNETLNAAGFTESRSFRVHAGDVLVDGISNARHFDVSADAGSILVSGTINSGGTRGGEIALRAAGNLTLANGSRLSVAAEEFNSAGQGGSIWLEAGSQTNGNVNSAALLDLQTGSTIDLSVAANPSLGQLSGKLHLRAPQTASNTDLQMAPLNGAITGASVIEVEGYRVFDLTATGGQIDLATQNDVRANGTAFGAADPAMRARLLAGNTGLSNITVIEPGAELINRTGDLTLGIANSQPSADWDLSTFRFGPNNAPGGLTLRAAGNVVFYNTLSDGFTSSAYDAELLLQNTALPANAQSWSYHIASGADFSAADFHRVLAFDLLSSGSGSVLLGKNYGNNSFPPSGAGLNAIAAAVRNRYQVIRTGSGEIDIASGRDVQLLNQFATIFTVGTRVADPTMGGSFDVPVPDPTGQTVALGPTQQAAPGYQPQYSYAGGNISISAQNDIAHYTRGSSGELVADSSRELPNNWLYRRGFVDPATGEFGAVTRPGRNDIGSTTWWIDFSNFFEGIGTLGGGNIDLAAGRNVSNVDAVAPTNARMPKGLPNAANLVELGGGDIVVRAGNDLDAGVYYVERGAGKLSAGGSIVTNRTRSPSLGTIATTPEIFAPETWLPTTLFIGRGTFDISARGDLLLGPTGNPFLLPQGINNTFWYKTYFATYGAESAVRAASLTSDLTLRESATIEATDAGSATPLLLAWFQNVLRFFPNSPGSTPSFAQPWLRLAENNLTSFSTLTTIGAPTLFATAFQGDLNLAGNLTLFPAARGSLELAARGALNGVLRNGSGTVNRVRVPTFGESRINLSDADPNSIPSIATPFAFRSTLNSPSAAAPNQALNATFLNPLNLSFTETGSTTGEAAVLQSKQARHAPGLLHLNDPDPVRIYATSGDVSGLTLFAGKPLRLIAGNDVRDIALYMQNNRADDISLVAAGRDLIAYDPNSPLRVIARTPGNTLNTDAVPATGDIQINGPGTLEVLAGRNFDLGVGPSGVERLTLGFRNDLGLGITSIGNARNPSLPFDGAEVVAGAGIGTSAGLAQSPMGFAKFEDDFLDPQTASERAARYLPELGDLLGLPENTSDAEVFAAYQELDPERQNNLALQVFYRVLRDAGRDFNDPESEDAGTYTAAFAVIDTLFPGDKWNGNISLTSREIKTSNGGNISLFAPGGQLLVGFDVSGTQAADQGILTERGGNISIYTKRSVVVGTSRIFTLRGGNEIIFSREGDIAAGASSKTVQAAPPTRVLIDPQSGDVQTDLAGLATGGGIGVLNTVAGVPPGDIDLIAPTGAVDAGDAGIRVSGNLNIAAVQVLNAGNIQTGGSSVGTPVVAAPNLGSLTAASNAVGAQTSATANTQPRSSEQQEPLPSIISVEVLGYGGGEGAPGDEQEDEEQRKRRREQQEQIRPGDVEPPPAEPLPQTESASVGVS